MDITVFGNVMLLGKDLIFLCMFFHFSKNSVLQNNDSKKYLAKDTEFLI